MRLEGIVKRHGATTVLHGVDLAIEPGEFFVLLGPSGSGKTTTLRILAGLETVSAGRVLMDGVDVTTPGAGRARRRDGVPELRALSAHDGRAEHRLPAEDGRHAGGARSSARSPTPPRRSTSATCWQRTPGQLSGGQQQRCALARAIVRQPRLFLLDEPLSNLDAKLRLETRLGLHKLQRSLGATTVYVTHDQEEAMTLADRIAVFMDGRIVQVGTPREIFATPQTVAVAGFIGTPPMNLLPATWRRRDVGSASARRAAGVGRGDRRQRRARGDARRAPRRPAHRADAACRRRSSASRTSATAASSSFDRRRAAAEAEERPAADGRRKASTSPSPSRRRRPTCSTRRPARGSMPAPPNPKERTITKTTANRTSS